LVPFDEVVGESFRRDPQGARAVNVSVRVVFGPIGVEAGIDAASDQPSHIPASLGGGEGHVVSGNVV